MIQCLMLNFGCVAQWIEQPPSKRSVTGSNPVASVFNDYGKLKDITFDNLLS
jgi:hypothetical protein